MNKITVILPLIFIFTPFAFADSSNTGTVYWKQDVVSSNSFAQIYVIDDDMNKKEYPNFADKFTITVWSDTSPDGLQIEVLENGVYSGIFKGSVYIADSGETSKNRLVSNPGDTLYAKYVDHTLQNNDDVLEIISAAVVKIPGQDMNEILNMVDPTIRNKIPIQSQIPEWIKTNAGWWADGAISDDEFVSGIQHLIKTGILSVSFDKESKQTSSIDIENIDTELTSLYHDLEKCSEISTAYKRIDCQKPIKNAISLYDYKTNGEAFPVGPITYYWKGINSEGNEFSVTSSGQAILSIRMLAENTSSEIVAINCTSPQICAYDVSNGEKEFKYSGMDFTSGQIVMNPGDSREFNLLFGPNIGYGGTQFEYDRSKEYFFRINEDFGKSDIPLKLR